MRPDVMIYSTWKGCVLNILLVGLKMAINLFFSSKLEDNHHKINKKQKKR